MAGPTCNRCRDKYRNCTGGDPSNGTRCTQCAIEESSGASIRPCSFSNQPGAGPGVGLGVGRATKRPFATVAGNAEDHEDDGDGIAPAIGQGCPKRLRRPIFKVPPEALKPKARPMPRPKPRPKPGGPSKPNPRKREEPSPNEYEVEAILDSDKENGVRRFLIKWLGYPADQSSWEPHYNVGSGAVAEWEREKKRKEQEKSKGIEKDKEGSLAELVKKKQNEMGKKKDADATATADRKESTAAPPVGTFAVPARAPTSTVGPAAPTAIPPTPAPAAAAAVVTATAAFSAGDAMDLSDDGGVDDGAVNAGDGDAAKGDAAGPSGGGAGESPLGAADPDAGTKDAAPATKDTSSPFSGKDDGSCRLCHLNRFPNCDHTDEHGCERCRLLFLPSADRSLSCTPIWLLTKTSRIPLLRRSMGSRVRLAG